MPWLTPRKQMAQQMIQTKRVAKRMGSLTPPICAGESESWRKWLKKNSWVSAPQAWVKE